MIIIEVSGGLKNLWYFVREGPLIFFIRGTEELEGNDARPINNPGFISVVVFPSMSTTTL